MEDIIKLVKNSNFTVMGFETTSSKNKFISNFDYLIFKSLYSIKREIKINQILDIRDEKIIFLDIVDINYEMQSEIVSLVQELKQYKFLISTQIEANPLHYIQMNYIKYKHILYTCDLAFNIKNGDKIEIIKNRFSPLK